MYQWILQVSIQRQEKSRFLIFSYLVRMISDSYPSLNKKQLILCSEYIYFGYKTPLALPAMLALLSLDVKMTSLGLISSSTLHSHKKAARIGPHSTLLENISSAKKGKIQASKHTYQMKQMPIQKTMMTYTSWKQSL